MDTAGRDYYPSGDLRVSDADRDRALSELGDALQAGRITAGEFDQRSGQVLAARTGQELTAPLADLPPDRAPATRASATGPPATGAVGRRQRVAVTRFTIGASAAATCFALVAVANALRPDPTLAQRELLQEVLARQGLLIPVPPAPGFDWAGTITPGAVAVLLVVLLIFVRVTRTARS